MSSKRRLSTRISASRVERRGVAAELLGEHAGALEPQGRERRRVAPAVVVAAVVAHLGGERRGDPRLGVVRWPSAASSARSRAAGREEPQQGAVGVEQHRLRVGDPPGAGTGRAGAMIPRAVRRHWRESCAVTRAAHRPRGGRRGPRGGGVGAGAHRRALRGRARGSGGRSCEAGSRMGVRLSRRAAVARRAPRHR